MRIIQKQDQASCTVPALSAMNLPAAAYPPLMAGTAAGAAPSMVTLALAVCAT